MPASEFDLIAAINERLPARGRPGSGRRAGTTPRWSSPRARAPSRSTRSSTACTSASMHFGAPAVGRKALAAGALRPGRDGGAAGRGLRGRRGARPSSPTRPCSASPTGSPRWPRGRGSRWPAATWSRSPVLMVSVTAVGYEPRRSRLVTSAGAGPGDLIAVTGRLGGAAGALALMERSRAGPSPRSCGEAMLARQLDPAPRLREGMALAAEGATAMIDISDGLGADAGHLARPAGAGWRSTSIGSRSRRGWRRLPGAAGRRSSSPRPAARTTSCSSRCRPSGWPRPWRRWRRRAPS